MSTNVSNDLLDKLNERQGKLSNYKFAERIGITPSLWQMIKNGKREVGITLLRAILKAYPELSRDVLIFLVGDVQIGKGDVLGSTTVPSETPSILQRFLKLIRR